MDRPPPPIFGPAAPRPYRVVGDALLGSGDPDTFDATVTHNPHLARLRDGRYLLFYIGPGGPDHFVSAADGTPVEWIAVMAWGMGSSASRCPVLPSGGPQRTRVSLFRPRIASSRPRITSLQHPGSPPPQPHHSNTPALLANGMNCLRHPGPACEREQAIGVASASSLWAPGGAALSTAACLQHAPIWAYGRKAGSFCATNVLHPLAIKSFPLPHALDQCRGGLFASGSRPTSNASS